MKEILFVEKTKTPCENKILVRIEDKYSLKESKGGILLSNAAHEEAEADSPGFNLSEWIIRSGVVEEIPRKISSASYDWYPAGEINKGDIVYWPIVRFFDYPVIRSHDGLFVLVDYHDIFVKRVGPIPIPINGYYLFTQEIEKQKALEYVVEKPTGWYKLIRMGMDVKYEYEGFNFKPLWKPGHLCYLNVPPFKLESDTGFDFKEKYYLAQKRHILIAKC